MAMCEIREKSIPRIEYFIYLLLLGFTYTFIYNVNSANFTTSKILGCIALLQYALTIYTWYKTRHSLFDAYIVFITAFYAFNISQPILEGLGVDFTYRRLYEEFLSTQEYYCATFYSMLCLLFFHLGALVEVGKRDRTHVMTMDASRNTNAIYKASILCIVISLPFYLYGLIQDYITVQVYGYVGLYEVESKSRIMDLIADFYTPSFIAYYFSALYKKKNIIVPLIIMVTTIFIPPLILGGRSNAMIILAIIIVVYSSFKKLSLKKVSIILSAIIIALFLMNVAGQLRQTQDKSLAAYEQMTKDKDSNPVVSTLSEMGWSMFPLGITTTAIPYKKTYDYGASFFWSAFSVIPNVGIWKEHPSQTHSAASWLNKYSGYSYGIGYSLIAECYNDFGPLCFVFIFLIGIWFTRFFKNVSNWSAHNNPMKYVLSVLFLWFSIKCVRNGCDGMVRGAAYCILPLFCMFKLMGAKKS